MGELTKDRTSAKAKTLTRRQCLQWMAAAPVLMAAGPLIAAEGKAAPFTLRDLKNKSWELSEVLKSGPAVLSFWATWCRPCQGELPLLEAIHQDYKSKGVQLLAISVDAPRDKSQVQQTVRRLKLTMPIPLDPEGQVLSRFHPSRSLPYLVVVKPSGEIDVSYKGFTPDIAPKLRARLDGLLSEASGAQ